VVKKKLQYKKGTEQEPDKYNPSPKIAGVKNEEQLWRKIFRISRQNRKFLLS
jgi:hypothetical protein